MPPAEFEPPAAASELADVRAMHLELLNYTLSSCDTSKSTITIYLLFLQFQVLAANLRDLLRVSGYQKPEKEEVKNGWGKIRTGEVHNLSPPNILG
jgi:hypothetical protein